MTTFVAKSGWIAEQTNRLTASTYAGGGLDVRDRIRAGALPWLRLADLAHVFRGPLHKRIYVTDDRTGVPYLTASDVALIDLPRDAFLSRKLTDVLEQLIVKPGWTLISSAGTVGNTTYVRDDHAAFLVSQDMLRVAPNSSVPSGYLSAFLATNSARAMLQLGAYGSVVDRIEPEHIVDLPVPLPSESDQQTAHAHMVAAAEARVNATKLLDVASSFYDGLVGEFLYSREHQLAVGALQRAGLGSRLDAFHHIGWASEVPRTDCETIGEMAEVVSTQRVPRIYVRDGVPFLSGIDVFRARPTHRVHLARFVAERLHAYLHAGELAIQGSGQRYGLLGRAAFVGGRLGGWAASHDLFRIRSDDPAIIARVFSYLRSDAGHRAMLRHSYGTSIPHVNPSGIADVRIPELPPHLLNGVVHALELREQADAEEERAIRDVETWLD